MDRLPPLQLAASYGHTEVVRFFLAKMEQTSIARGYDETAHHNASIRDHVAAAFVSIDHGADDLSVK
jgi:ankyrin repeat protein